VLEIHLCFGDELDRGSKHTNMDVASLYLCNTMFCAWLAHRLLLLISARPSSPPTPLLLGLWLLVYDLVVTRDLLVMTSRRNRGWFCAFGFLTGSHFVLLFRKS